MNLLWFKNQILFKNLKEVLISFHNQGIKTMVLKGAALISLYFNNLSIRPQNDVDLLILPESVSRACDILKTSGWNIKGRPKKGIIKLSLLLNKS